MGRQFTEKELNEILSNYDLGKEQLELKNYGSGYINDTFLAVYRQSDGQEKRFILQRINTEVFKRVNELMENFVNVTNYLRKIIEKNGGDPLRETLNVVPDKNGGICHKDVGGNYWRILLFIEDTVSYDKAETKEIFYESGVAFGRFQYMLSDFPAKTLYDSIPDFHNTPKRYLDFERALKADVLGRSKYIEDEIQFVLARKDEAPIVYDKLKRGELPLRVTHNDTKLNNVLLDKKTGKGICVIDLDTVMPGTAVYDFGDAIRYGAYHADEDEKDLRKVVFLLELFETYVEGYLKGCSGSLTNAEIEMLPMGAKLITYENGLRFLTDYLEGDVYYKINREGQNLDRCRTQFKLVKDMEANWESMNDIIQKYRN